MKEIKYYLGADGGGTKTEFVLTDAAGAVVRHCRLAGSNPNDVGMDTTKRLLREGIDTLCAGIPLEEVSFYAGIAGVGGGGAREEMSRWAAAQGLGHGECHGDIDNIMAAGLGTRDGIAVILGTGFVCFGRRRLQAGEADNPAWPGWNVWQVGGWGSFFDNGGSGYHFGRDALYAVLSAVDGSGAACPILQQLTEQKLGCSVPQAIPVIYQKGKDFIASFAPLAFEAAQQGDAVAQKILQSNISEAARMIATAVRLAQGVEQPVPVVLAGGLTRAPGLPKMLAKALRQQNAAPVQMAPLAVRPVYGALLLAGMLPSQAAASFCAVN